jgi:hypothetical protein
VVLRVLLEIAMESGRADLLGDPGTFYELQVLELDHESTVALDGHRNAFHRNDSYTLEVGVATPA